MWNVLIGIITHSTFCFDWFGSLFSFLLLLNSVNGKKSPNLNCRPVSLHIWHLSQSNTVVCHTDAELSKGSVKKRAGPSVWFRCELFQFCLSCCLCNSVFIKKENNFWNVCRSIRAEKHSWRQPQGECLLASQQSWVFQKAGRISTSLPVFPH